MILSLTLISGSNLMKWQSINYLERRNFWWEEDGIESAIDPHSPISSLTGIVQSKSKTKTTISLAWNSRNEVYLVLFVHKLFSSSLPSKWLRWVLFSYNYNKERVVEKRYKSPASSLLKNGFRSVDFFVLFLFLQFCVPFDKGTDMKCLIWDEASSILLPGRAEFFTITSSSSSSAPSTFF